MNSVPISLGDVTFEDFEVPEKIEFNGARRVAFHPLIGGGRAVDILGHDDGDVAFSGVFSGAAAAQRAQRIETACKSGTVVPLAWDSFFYAVIITEFSADFEKKWWIPFSVRCVVVHESLSSFVADNLSKSNIVSGNIAMALGLAGQAGISLASFVPNLSGMANMQQIVGTDILNLGSVLDKYARSINEAPDAFSGVSALQQLTGSSSSLAALTGLSGYVNRTLGNLESDL